MNFSVTNSYSSAHCFTTSFLGAITTTLSIFFFSKSSLASTEAQIVFPAPGAALIKNLFSLFSRNHFKHLFIALDCQGLNVIDLAINYLPNTHS